MIDFDGSTYSPAHDRGRLSAQLTLVYYVMSDGVWRTPAEIERAVGASWASIGARLRDLRKPKFGGYTVERRRCGRGLFEYRLIVREG